MFQIADEIIITSKNHNSGVINVLRTNITRINKSTIFAGNYTFDINTLKQRAVGKDNCIVNIYQYSDDKYTELCSIRDQEIKELSILPALKKLARIYGKDMVKEVAELL